MIAEVIIVGVSLFYCKFINKLQVGNVNMLWCTDCTTSNSLTWFDKFSFVHFYLGVACFTALRLTDWSSNARRVAMLSFVALFEMVENSSYVIKKWAQVTSDRTYNGDALINVFTDIACAAIGYGAVERFGVLPMAILYGLLQMFDLFPRTKLPTEV